MATGVLISAAELRDRLEEIATLDCRYRLAEPEYGSNRFLESHIPGAFFMDLNDHLASKVGKTGGRHPLPDIDCLKERLEEAGISNDTEVVCYDDNLSGAGRCWFLLRYMGLSNVRVLNGGFQEWESGKFHTEKGKSIFRRRGHVNVKLNEGMLATYVDILNSDGNHKVIDAREAYRYEGKEEPIDKIAGRIPGAINIPHSELMEGAKLKSREELRNYLKGVKDGDILYCGSGVTSCVNLLAMEELGIKPRLYVGSYSDWISRNLEVEKS